MVQVTFKGKPTKLSGRFPSVGMKAIDWKLVAADLSDKTPEDYYGKKKIIAIAPSLDTAVCSSMAKMINQTAKQYPKVVFLFITCDLPFAQKRFCIAEGAENIITLSVMRDRKFPEDYGVLIKDGPLKGICARALIVVDENNLILHANLVDEITEEPDYKAAIAHLQR